MSKYTLNNLTAVAGFALLNSTPVHAAIKWADIWANQWVQVYLFGCIAAAIVLLISTAIRRLAFWFVKGPTLHKNLQKIGGEPQSLQAKLTIWSITFLGEVLLSWVAVVLNIGSLILFLLKAVREMFTSVPAELKILRFPLYNNPDMTTESVWAHTIALRIKGGNDIEQWELADELNTLQETKNYFRPLKALEMLEHLQVADRGLLDDVKKEFTEALP